MRTSTLLAPLAAALLASLAVGSLGACTADASGGGHVDPPGPGLGPIAQSSAPRTPATSIPTSSLAGAVTANNAFAVDLYAHALATDATDTAKGNFLTSPISASLALTMTYAGANGQTASQMATALHYGPAASSIFDGQNALTQALASRAAAALAADTKNAQEGEVPAPDATDYALDVVNSIWGEQTYTWNAPFLSTMASSYGTGVRLADFIGQPDTARISINDWVSSATSNKITDLIPQGAIDDTTRMVLVNAIHLKLPWANPFEAAQTMPQAFTTGSGATVTTPFMHQGLTTAYVDDGAAQIVALPLAGSQLSVVFAMPHGDLAAYAAGLSASSAALSVPTKEADIVLTLPKFAFTSPSFSLAKALQAMGMTLAFDKDNADFTGLCSQPPDGDRLYISDVLQKAMIAVQETGVEAAAATAVLVAGTSAEEMPVPVTIDRPFLVSIVDQPTGAVLFLGQITDPTDMGSP